MTKTFTTVMLGISLCLPTLTWADFQTGANAYDRDDYETALKAWHPLAMEGHVSAQYRLGLIYEQGQHVTQDYQEAMKWYHLAADQGHVGAKYRLGVMH